MSYSVFRRGAQSTLRSAKSSKSGGGKWKGSWALRWSPPKKDSPNQVGQPVLILPGEYVDLFEIDPTTGQNPVQPWHRRKVHKFNIKGNFRSVTCSSGTNPHNPQPCAACVEADRRSQSKDSKGEARDVLTFSVLHLWPYHSIPYVKEGQVIYKKDENGNITNEPVRIDKECEMSGNHQRCQYCQQREPVTFGKVRYMETGTNHFANVVESIADKIGSTCKNCKTTIRPLGYICNNPQCPSHTYVNPQTKQQEAQWMLCLADSNLTNDELRKYADSPASCRWCNVQDYPREIAICGFDPPGMNQIQNPCDNTVRRDIFDTILYLQREGEKTASKIVSIYEQPAEEFSYNGMTLAQIADNLKAKPLDLDSILAPESLEEQCSALQIPNPYEAQQHSGFTPPIPTQQQNVYNPYPNVPHTGRPPYNS